LYPEGKLISQDFDAITHYIDRAEYDEAIKIIDEKKKLPSSEVDKFLFRIFEAKILRYQGSFSESANRLKGILSTTLLEQDPSVYLMAISEYAYSIFYLNMHDEAEQFVKRGIELYKKLHLNLSPENLNTEATFYHVLGIIQLRKLRLDQSYDNLIHALNLRKTYGSNLEIGYSYLNIGIHYYYKGEFGPSKDNLNSSLEVLEPLNNELAINFVKSYLGVIEILQGNIQTGEKLLLESINTIKNYDNIVLVSQPYYELAYGYLMKGLVDPAKSYIDKLGKMLEINHNEVVWLRYEFVHALWYKRKGRLKYVAQAQEKFLKIIEHPILDTMVHVSSIKHYCDLLIDEMKLSQNPEILSEVKLYIEKLYDIGIHNRAMSIVVESLILKSKITLLEDNPSEMIEILESAKIVADAYKLTQLLSLIDAEISRFILQVQKWENLKSEGIYSDEEGFKEYLNEIQSFMRKTDLGMSD
jgi:tetratricopeptide (TPR) repeat protein